MHIKHTRKILHLLPMGEAASWGNIKEMCRYEGNEKRKDVKVSILEVHHLSLWLINGAEQLANY